MRKRQQTVCKVSFECDLKPNASSVFLVGDFNKWNPTACPMQKEGGVFKAAVPLRPREYAYKFLVDGESYHDPHAEFHVWNGPSDVSSVITARVKGQARAVLNSGGDGALHP